MRKHEKFLLRLESYLKVTIDKGTVYLPYTDKGLEVYVYECFAGNWYKEDSKNTDTTGSIHGFVILYKG